MRNVRLRFSGGLEVGSWEVPHPERDPVEFNRVAEVIGFHVALAIHDGEEGCEFLEVEEIR